MRSNVLTCFYFFAIVSLGLPQCWAEKYALILIGSGGEASFQEKFDNWGNQLAELCASHLGFNDEKVFVLSATSTENATGAKSISLESIQESLESLSLEIGEEDDFYLFIIGHGSYLRQESKFHIPGDDLTANQLKLMLANLQARHLIVINSTSSSAGFINALSGPGRVICTATKSIEERNATEFMRFFLQALESGSADQNHDERITVLEACNQAAVLTRDWYKSEGYIATEHALLDDNGDERGTALPFEPIQSTTDTVKADIEGQVASRIYLKDYIFPEHVPQEMVDIYLTLLRNIDDLKLKKDSLEAQAYYQNLEELFVQAAKAHRDIRYYPTPERESGPITVDTACETQVMSATEIVGSASGPVESATESVGSVTQ